MYNRFIYWLESHEMACYNKKLFGIECPGCGMQRSFIELLKGNLIESLKLYPALIPIIIMLVFAVLHLVFDIKKGALILKILFIFNVALILINYIYKLIFIY
jgi:hypothetical protein